jgi:hypothetical protein
MEIVSHKLFVEFLVNDSDMVEFVEFLFDIHGGVGSSGGVGCKLSIQRFPLVQYFFSEFCS